MGERRADLDDDAAVTRPHPPQRGERPVHRAEVGDFGHAPHLVRAQLADGREDGQHRVVDPDVDRAQLRLDGGRGCVDRLRVRDVEREDERTATEPVDLAPRGLEPVSPPREQAEGGAAAGELARAGAADAGRGPGNDDDAARHHAASETKPPTIAPYATCATTVARGVLRP